MKNVWIDFIMLFDTTFELFPLFERHTRIIGTISLIYCLEFAWMKEKKSAKAKKKEKK